MRILIAEDDDISRRTLSALLSKDGYDVVETANGMEAWEELQKPDAPHLAILDWMMPEMDGLEVVRRIRTLETNSPYYLIILTVMDEKSDTIIGLDAGADDYITKPFDAGILQARVAVGRRLIEIQEKVASQMLDLQQAQESLRESETTFRSLFEKAPTGTAYNRMVYDQTGKPINFYILQANQSYQKLTGTVDPVGKLVTEAFPGIENDPFDWIGTFGHVAKSGKEIRFQQRFQFNDRWYDLVAYQNKPDHFVAAFLEITEQKLAEAALIESEDRFRSMLESIPNVSVQGYNRERQVIFWNKASEALYGYSQAEALGCRLETLIIPEYMRSDVISAVNCWLTDGVPIPAGEIDLQKKDGSQVSVYSSHVMQKNSRGEAEMYCVDIDLTERKQAEEAQEKLQLQLAQAQKMESVGRLAGGVAHDFNNKLSVIMGYVELALLEVGTHQPLLDKLKEISKAANSSADLTRQLLAFARKQTVAPQVLDLNDTVEGMLKMLRRLIGEDITLSWLPGTDLWPVKMDPSQIDQMLANLCVNARDAIDGIGKITIETQQVTFDEDYCSQLPDAVCGDYVALVVCDDGCGMDTETLANIFEPFFTTKSVGEGTGLGLATVYGVVKQNGGFITVSSEPGRSTTFSVYLPRYLGKNSQKKTESLPEQPAIGNETILLVEDVQEILDVTTLLLKSVGYTILPAITPGEAMRLAREHAGEIHLLITDVVMPEMNGRDLARSLSSLYPNIKRLFMSGYTADIIANQGMIEAGVNFLQKPFSMKVLADKVREVLEQR